MLPIPISPAANINYTTRVIVSRNPESQRTPSKLHTSNPSLPSVLTATKPKPRSSLSNNPRKPSQQADHKFNSNKTLNLPDPPTRSWPTLNTDLICNPKKTAKLICLPDQPRLQFYQTASTYQPKCNPRTIHPQPPPTLKTKYKLTIKAP